MVACSPGETPGNRRLRSNTRISESPARLEGKATIARVVTTSFSREGDLASD